MTTHRDMDDGSFLQVFLDGSLPPNLFNHEAHLRLGFIYIRQYGADTAGTLLCRDLQTFVERLGAADKFNTTLTVAAVHIVDHFMKNSPQAQFYDLIQLYPLLSTSFRHLIEQHYATDIFNSEAAKHSYLPPDRAPFPS